MGHTNKQPISDEKRREILEEKIMMYQAGGKRLESQIGFQAVLVTEKKVNHLLHLVSLHIYWWAMGACLALRCIV